MTPIHDTDVLLLLAIALASKRKPADLDELVLALALTDKRLPAEAKLLEAFTRLSTHGLVVQDAEGFSLTEAAQKVLAIGKKTYELEERMFRVRERLAEYHAAPGTHAAIQVPADQLAAAVAAYQATLPPPTKTEKAVLKREQAMGNRRPAAPRSRPGPARKRY